MHQRCQMGLAYDEIARRLNVDPSTVYRTVQRFEDTGDVQSIQGYHEHTTKKLSSQEELAIIEAVLDNPSTYLHELQNMIYQSAGTDLNVSTICRYLKQNGFSRRKLTFRAQQRSEELRQDFTSEIALYEPHMLVFIDETGSDKRSSLRKYGYSPKGTPAIAEKKLVRGKRHSAIAAMCMDGVIDVHITTDTVDEGAFCTFIERCILPQLLPFNGCNPRSVVIMDNASIHHTGQAVSLIEETGAIPLFLPPYSPDFMPIEECFSKVKSYIRACDPAIQVMDDDEIDDVILGAFASVTSCDCYNWMKHCGYM